MTSRTGFNNLKEQEHYIIGYVIMPSHIHTIVAFSNTGKALIQSC